MHDRLQPPARIHRRIWPIFVVGLGLLAAMAWIALLGWLALRAVLWLF